MDVQESEWAELALVALIMDGLVAIKGDGCPRQRPGQTLQMSLVWAGLASVAAKAGATLPKPGQARAAVGDPPSKRGRGRPRKEDSSRVVKEAVPVANLAEAETAYYLKLREVMRITGESRTSIYRGMEAGTFPKQVLTGLRKVCWVRLEVIAWCEKKKRASREGVEGVMAKPTS